MPRIFWQPKVTRYRGLGGRDIFTEDPVKSIVVLFNGISFVVAEMF